MKHSKLFFLGLLVSLSTYAHVHAAAAEQEVKEQAEVKEAAATESKAKTLELILKNLATKQGKRVNWPAALTKKIEEYTPTFEEESVTLGEKYGQVEKVITSPDERYIALQALENVIVYDMQNLQEILNIPITPHTVLDTQFFSQKNGYQIAVIKTLPFRYEFYDLKNRKKGPTTIIAGDMLEYNKDYLVIKLPDEQDYALYHLPDMRKEMIFPDINDEDFFIVFSPDNHYVALNSRKEGKIKIYDLYDLAKAPIVLEGDTIDFAPDNRSAAVFSKGKPIKFYILPEFTLSKELEGNSVKFSPKGRYVAVYQKDFTYDVYKNDDFSLIKLSYPIVRIDFFPNDRYIAFTDKGSNRTEVYDSQKLDKPIAVFSGDGLLVSPLGGYVVDFGNKLYARENLHAPLSALAFGINTPSTRFSARDRYYVAALNGGGVTVYNLLKLKKQTTKELLKAFIDKAPAFSDKEAAEEWLAQFNRYFMENIAPKR